eukprot:208907-Karenia_brevis.AAC.1
MLAQDVGFGTINFSDKANTVQNHQVPIPKPQKGLAQLVPPNIPGQNVILKPTALDMEVKI